jgi:endonuclease/exonuclease/phosphatase family metal-dependent hydrolase
MAQRWPNEWVFWGFMPAGNRRTGKEYLCKNGDAYGIGILGRLFTTSTPTVTAHGHNYPPDRQDPSDNELRSWLCVDANHSYWGCTTHLLQGGGQTTLDQCDFLTKQVIAHQPTVVAGDLNLRYQPGTRFNVQQCVPSGWFRKGDGDVQHTMATNDFTFNGSRKLPMKFTDHPAWAVSLTKPE